MDSEEVVFRFRNLMSKALFELTGAHLYVKG